LAFISRAFLFACASASAFFVDSSFSFEAVAARSRSSARCPSLAAIVF